jgi:hypothetical protein
MIPHTDAASHTDAQAKALAFKESVEFKIRGLIDEFAAGKISREQFHIIYERYNAQLSIATHAVVSGNPDAVAIVQGGPPTIAIRDAAMGKATGMTIFHNRSAATLETLGDFPVTSDELLPTLRDARARMTPGGVAERRVEKLNDRQWLTFTFGQYTTVVTLFSRQPSEQQNREIERLHRDYERANAALLPAERLDGASLACPFLIFVLQKVKR